MQSCSHVPVVVDNASRDGSADAAAAAGAEVIRNPRNLGFGTGCNIGARAGCAPLILFLNPDATLEDDTLVRLEAAAAADPGAGAWAPRIVEADGRLFFRRRSFLLPRGVRQPVPEADADVLMLSGAVLMVRRTAFEAIGGFDETIFLFHEDDDLCLRLTRAGWRLRHVHGAVARHGRGRSSGETDAMRHFRAREAALSQTHVAAKHGRPLRVAIEIWRARWRRIVARLQGRRDRVAALSGRIDGLLAARASQG